MYLIFRSKDEWSWAGNENWIRRKENLLSIVGRVTAMALSNRGCFEIRGILGTKLVFTQIATSVVVMSWDFQRCTMSCLFAGTRGRPGRAWSTPASFARSPPRPGCVFWFHLSSYQVCRWLRDLRSLAPIHSRRCCCLPTDASFMLSLLTNLAGYRPWERGWRERCSRGKRGSITRWKFSSRLRRT